MYFTAKLHASYNVQFWVRKIKHISNRKVTSVSIATVNCQNMLRLEIILGFNYFRHTMMIYYCSNLGPLRNVFSVLASAAVRLTLESAAVVKLSSSAIKVFRYGFSTPKDIQRLTA